MVYGCRNQCIKFLIFATNFLLFSFGAIVFGVSLWANLDQNFAQHLNELAHQAKIDDRFVSDLAQYQVSLWVLMAVGAVLMLVGFLGCCGAVCESPVMLCLYFVLILLLAVVELFVLVVLFSNRVELLNSVHQVLAKSAESAETRQNLLLIEKTLHCCGATVETAHIYHDDCVAAGLVGVPDCYSVLSDKLESMCEIILFVGVALLIVQAFAMIFSCVLNRAFREQGPAYYA